MSTQRERRLRAKALNSATALREFADDPNNFTHHKPPFTVSWKDGEGPHVEKLDPAIEAVLTDVWGGAHNVKVREAFLEPRPHARVLTRRGLSTFDDDSLTRLVVACHRHAVRAELAEGGFGATAIWLHKRERGADKQQDRHADLDDLALLIHQARGNACLTDQARDSLTRKEFEAIERERDRLARELADAQVSLESASTGLAAAAAERDDLAEALRSLGKECTSLRRSVLALSPPPESEQPLRIDAAELREHLKTKTTELLALVRRCARSGWSGSDNAKDSISLAVSALQDAIAATPKEDAGR